MLILITFSNCGYSVLNSIQIHLMLILISVWTGSVLCGIGDSNTSNVNLNLGCSKGSPSKSSHSNTSNVNLNLMQIVQLVLLEENSNTSNVNLNRKF